MVGCILAIDQGTTSTKAIVVDESGSIRATSGNFGITALHPKPGWVEFDPEQMLGSVVAAAEDALDRAGLRRGDVAAVGLANQGETVIAFDAELGQPIHNAISWQDKRGSEIVERWRANGIESEAVRRTGLRLDPYFSASKMRWVIESLPEARRLLGAGRLRLGTSDAWLLAKLTGEFVTDVSTASRTMLFDLESMSWDAVLLEATGIPVECLPAVVDNAPTLRLKRPREAPALSSMPMAGLCVDQQAALFGQRRFARGQAKATYGTGCFVLANAGDASDSRRDGVLTSVGWRIGDSTAYVFDGGIYSAGSMLNWLRDGLGLFSDFDEMERLASSVDDPGGVCLFPAFAGLGAPYWESGARAAFVGLTLGTGREHIARATAEAIAFRVKDVVDTMNGPDLRIDSLCVDGGLTRSSLLMQLQADLLGVPLVRGESHEATAYGVALMAGIGSGMWTGTGDLPAAEPRVTFEPRRCAVTDGLLGRYERWREVAREMIRCRV